MTGGKLFTMEDELQFSLEPIIPAEYFKEGIITFKLFGNIEVVLINRTGRDTFGDNPAKITKYELVSNDSVVLTKVKGKHARDIREGKVTKIIVTLK